jgi:hypothetical protein
MEQMLKWHLHAFGGSSCGFLLEVVEHGLDCEHQQDHVIANKFRQCPDNVSNEVQGSDLSLELGAKGTGQGGKKREEGSTVANHFAKSRDGILGGNLDLALFVTKSFQHERKLRGNDSLG